MADIADGEKVEVKGSGVKPYVLKNSGGVYSCTCPAWRNQSIALEKRTCKHLRGYRGDAAEDARVGSAAPREKLASNATVKSAKADTAEPPLLLAHSWDNEVDLAGWWMSEKLDGVRAYWDGKKFWSRLGNEFIAPKWFTEGLPDFPLDGELWSGRKRFQRTVSIVRRQDASEDWREISYLVFDAPKLDAPFEERLERYHEALAAAKLPHARGHGHVRCEGVDHLRRELARVESLGGEGLMLRKPGSRYEVGRSFTLLKVKSFKDDEARVVGHVAGAGKHKGRLGALEVVMKDGTRFSVGTGFTDAEREAPPPIGTIITFRYQELSEDGVPRFPTYLRVRPDTRPEDFPDVKSTRARAETAASASPPKKEKTAKEEPKKEAAPATPSPAKNGLRHFEYVGGGSNKFWAIEVSGSQHTVHFGRIGTKGQTKTKTFDDAPAAAKDAARLVQEKTREGYLEKSP